MQPTITGLFVVALGVWCQFGGYQRTLMSLVLLTQFEAANAATLTALGGSSITPSKFFLLFFALRLVSMKNGFAALFDEISPRRPLFIYLLLSLWVAVSGILFPRLFANMTLVYSLDRGIVDFGAFPLKSSSGNITQSVYAMGSFFIAVGVSVFGRQKGALQTVVTAILILTGLNIFFAVADIVTSATNTGFLLDFVHTGNYSLLTADDVDGQKRIAGSFTEASSFATFSLDLLAINFTLFIGRVKPRLTGAYSVILFALLFLSTSSTAYVGLAVLLTAFGIVSIYFALRHRNVYSLKIFILTVGAALLSLCVLYLVAPSIVMGAWTLLDVSVLQKSTSESALERGAMNAQAIQVFLDTYGIGAGVGSTRVSNYFLVLASNLGVVGLLLFAMLLIALTFQRVRSDLSIDERKILAAMRVGMLASLVPATLIATILDLGPLFYILVGMVASSSEVGPAPSSAPRPVGPFDSGAAFALNRRAAFTGSSARKDI